MLFLLVNSFCSYRVILIEKDTFSSILLYLPRIYIQYNFMCRHVYQHQMGEYSVRSFYNVWYDRLGLVAAIEFGSPVYGKIICCRDNVYACLLSCQKCSCIYLRDYLSTRPYDLTCLRNLITIISQDQTFRRSQRIFI